MTDVSNGVRKILPLPQVAISRLLVQLDVPQRSSNQQKHLSPLFVVNRVSVLMLCGQLLWHFDSTTSPWFATDSHPTDMMSRHLFQQLDSVQVSLYKVVHSSCSCPSQQADDRMRPLGSSGSLLFTFGSIGTTSTVPLATSASANSLIQMISNHVWQCVSVSPSRLVVTCCTPVFVQRLIP